MHRKRDEREKKSRSEKENETERRDFEANGL